MIMQWNLRSRSRSYGKWKTIFRGSLPNVKFENTIKQFMDNMNTYLRLSEMPPVGLQIKMWL